MKNLLFLPLMLIVACQCPCEKKPPSNSDSTSSGNGFVIPKRPPGVPEFSQTIDRATAEKYIKAHRDFDYNPIYTNPSNGSLSYNTAYIEFTAYDVSHFFEHVPADQIENYMIRIYIGDSAFSNGPEGGVHYRNNLIAVAAVKDFEGGKYSGRYTDVLNDPNLPMKDWGSLTPPISYSGSPADANHGAILAYQIYNDYVPAMGATPATGTNRLPCLKDRKSPKCPD